MTTVNRIKVHELKVNGASHETGVRNLLEVTVDGSQLGLVTIGLVSGNKRPELFELQVSLPELRAAVKNTLITNQVNN